MRKVLLAGVALALLAFNVSAQTADEIVAKYVKTIGGMEKVQAIKTVRRTGKFTGGGGFEAVTIDELKRPNLLRQEFQFQGFTGVNAFDGKAGWKIEPWQGKKDVETLSEEEMKQIVEDSDFDGPLINYKEKGNKIEYVGLEPVEGTDAHKLKVTLANGTVQHYYMDTDYFVPIKIETKRMIRGSEVEFETTLGDYKEAGGVYYPFSFESGVKGNPNTSKVTIEKIETNVALDNTRFVAPRGKSSEPPAQKDASQTLPKSEAEKTDKPPTKPLEN